MSNVKRTPTSTTTPGSPPPGAVTSENHPLYVSWVESSGIPAAAGWTGHLGMTILPGKHGRGMAGYHWRDLDEDVERLARKFEVTTFVLLVEDDELVSTGTSAIASTMAEDGIELLRFPIVDHGVPQDTGAFAALLGQVEERLHAGAIVVIACRGGLGRTGMTVACLLRDAGLSAEDAIALTRSSRKKTIETAAQEAFVRDWRPQ